MTNFRRQAMSTAAVLVSLLVLANTSNAQSRRGDPRDGLRGRPDSQPSAFDAYLKSLTFGTDPQSKRFDGDITCPDTAKCGGASSVAFVITPSDYVDDWDGAIKGTRNGHIVAKVFKPQGQSFDYWNLNGDDYFAYLWVGQMPDGPGAALYANRNGKMSRIYKFASIRKCTKEAGPPEVHINNPASCSETIGINARPVQLASLDPRSLLAKSAAQPPVQGGLWVSCTGGCCEVQYDF